MSREEEKQEKARELAIKYCKDIDPHGKEVYNIGCAIACCEMADWADQNPRKGLWDSKKVIAWLMENMNNYLVKGRDIDFIYEDLRKAMEE